MSGCHLWECQEICLNISGKIQLHCRQALQPLSPVFLLPQESGATPEGLGRAFCRCCRHSCHAGGLLGPTVPTQLLCLPAWWHGSLSQLPPDLSQCHHSLCLWGVRAGLRNLCWGGFWWAEVLGRGLGALRDQDKLFPSLRAL